MSYEDCYLFCFTKRYYLLTSRNALLKQLIKLSSWRESEWVQSELKKDGSAVLQIDRRGRDGGFYWGNKKAWAIYMAWVNKRCKAVKIEPPIEPTHYGDKIKHRRPDCALIVESFQQADRYYKRLSKCVEEACDLLTKNEFDLKDLQGMINALDEGEELSKMLANRLRKTEEK